GRDERERRRRLEDDPPLGTQNRIAQVDRAARGVEPAESVQALDESEARESPPVERHGPTAAEADDRRARSSGGRREERAGIERLRRQLLRVVGLASADRRSPEALVDGVAGGLGRDLHAAGLAVGGLVLAGNAAVADGSQDLDARSEDSQSGVESELVVAGGGRAVGDRPRADPARVAGDVLDLDRALGRDGEWIG